VFWFSVQCLSETFLIIWRYGREMIPNVYWFSFKVPHYSCPVLMKPDFFEHIYEKYSNIKFHENPSIGSRVVLCGRMDGRLDRRTDMTQLIVLLRDFAKEPKNCSWCSHCVYVFCTDLRTYSDFSLYSIKKLVLCNRREERLLCGTGWVLI